MSRTIKFAKTRGPEVLEFIEMEVPAPGPREVRIKVKAIGINRADSMWRNDKYTESVKFPAGLGYEAAGSVDAVGKDVAGLAAGDAASTIPAFSLNKYFSYGEVILAPDHAVVKHPESLSFIEAASVWMMFITAHGALVFDAQVKAGDFVIIPAASSSVGLAAIQIANYAGATSADGIVDALAGVDDALHAFAGAGRRPRPMVARVDPMPRRRKRGLCSGCV